MRRRGAGQGRGAEHGRGAGRGRGAAALLAAAALGAAALGVGLGLRHGPPQPGRPWGAIPPAGAVALLPPRTGGLPSVVAAASSPASAARAGLGPLPRLLPTVAALTPSTPVRVSIPVLGVRSTLVRLGLNPDGTIEVPTSFQQAGWWDGGATPGALGAAVLLGHVDSYAGPGVFYQLGRLRPRDLVEVARADGTTAVFQVRAVREYPKSAFPTAAVYGPVSYPGLRLVTCGGRFDPHTRSYESNVVVFAELVGVTGGITPG